MNQSKSSKCAAPKTQSKLLQTSGDIVEVKSSNNGKTAKIVMYFTSRALKVEGDKVSSMTPSMTIDEIVETVNHRCRRWDDLDERCFTFIFIMNSENGQKIAKVTSAKSVKRHGNKALEINLSAKDLTSTGTTANKATSFSDLQEEKDVSVSFTWNEPEEPEEDSVLDLVEKDKDLSTLEAALKAAGLDQPLADTYIHYTVFGPLNTAFDKLPAGTVEDLLLLKNKDELIQLLQKHVVEGKFDSAKLQKIAHSANPHLETLAGKRLQVRMSGQKLYVGKAKVVDADKNASNGLVHKINAVLA